MKVALVCIAKDEDNYIQEWIEYHLKLGFDNVFVYANNWDYKNDNNKVKVIRWDGEQVQDKAYKHFFENYNQTYQYAAMFDVDEFLVLKKHDNVKNFIEDYICSPGGIAINWVFFGTPEHKNREPKTINNEYSPLKRFTHRGPINHHIKTICRLPNPNSISKHNSINHVHWPIQLINDTSGNLWGGTLHPNMSKASIEVAQLNHYWTKSWEEWVFKVNKGRADNGSTRDLNEWHELDDLLTIKDTTALNFMYPDYE